MTRRLSAATAVAQLHDNVSPGTYSLSRRTALAAQPQLGLHWHQTDTQVGPHHHQRKQQQWQVVAHKRR